MAARLTTLIVISIVAATFIAGIITRAQRDEQGPVDLIVFNGKVYAGDGKTFAEAVAVRGNKIVLVGSNREVKRLRRPQTTVIDAHGGTVLPGFNDAHVHFLDGSLELTEIDLTGITTSEQLADRLRAYAVTHGHSVWVVGRGWSPEAFSGKPASREELDAAVPDRPVYLTSEDGRAALANSAALKLAGITRATRNPRSGTIVRNAKGEPTGVLKDAAVALVRRAVPPPAHADSLAALRTGIQEAHRLGVTSVQTAGTAADLALWDELRAVHELTVRAYHALEARRGASDADVNALEEIRREYGDDPLLKTGSVEIDAEDADVTAGPPRTARGASLTGADLQRLVTMLDRRGWQVSIRANGERGVRQALDAFQAAADANPAPARGRRHRIEHAMSIDPADVEQLARLGVIASLQPPHAGMASAPDEPFVRIADRTPAAPGWPWHGVGGVAGRFAFGSDWPAAALDPRVALRDVVAQADRAGLDGPQTPPSVPFSLATAIDAYTSGAAFASFDEQRKGTLAPGRLADIVILSGDIFSMPSDRLLDVTVDVTIFDGEVVYSHAVAGTD